VQVVTKSGESVSVDVSLARFEVPSRPGEFVLVMFRDVSERRRAERQSVELAQAEAARHAAEATIRKYQALVESGLAELQGEVHRLNRTVTRATSRAHARAQRLAVVQVRAERIWRKLEALAARSAIASNTFELRVERVNLVPMLSRVVTRMRSRSMPHKLNLALPQGLTALVDAERIEYVVQTLVVQAMHRSPHGCWIDLELKRPLVGLARIEVRDFGQPVSDEVRRQLAEMDGSDPDLMLARSIIEMHGGTLGFEFPADGGVRAVVTLPTHRGKITSGTA
jgi:K+-sensing histidine kinase KdpD